MKKSRETGAVKRQIRRIRYKRFYVNLVHILTKSVQEGLAKRKNKENFVRACVFEQFFRAFLFFMYLFHSRNTFPTIPLKTFRIHGKQI